MKKFQVLCNGIPCALHYRKGFDQDTFNTHRDACIFAWHWDMVEHGLQVAIEQATPMELNKEYDCSLPSDTTKSIMMIREIEVSNIPGARSDSEWTNLEKRQSEFLAAELKYFETTPRGVNKSGFCSYEGGCLVGHHLSKELCQKFDKMTEESSEIYGVCSDEIFKELPEELQALGQMFLGECQGLHDWCPYWIGNDTGGSDLTDQGKQALATIVKDHNLTL